MKILEAIESARTPLKLYAEITNIGDGPVQFRDIQGNTCLLVGYDARQICPRNSS